MAQKKCYHSHPKLPIVTQHGSYEIAGGSCILPAAMTYQVFIGLDRGQLRTARSFPWVPGEEFCYPIENNKPPKDAESFHDLIRFIWSQVSWRSSVHVGCIGGHGRTGLVLAALVAWVMEREDAIHYVREHYCERAVETQEQFDFLAEHYGCSLDGLKVVYETGPKTSQQLAAAWAGK